MIVFDREAGSLQGMYASGGVGFLHDMLGVAGGVNVFADVPRQSIQVSSELALTRAPEVILELHSGDPWTPDHVAREQAVWRKLPSLPAVRSGRIAMLVGDKMAIPGPRVVEAIQAMARVLHPGVF
jgi:iron complex transport system substrate-binding protein